MYVTKNTRDTTEKLFIRIKELFAPRLSPTKSILSPYQVNTKSSVYGYIMGTLRVHYGYITGSLTYDVPVMYP